MLGTILKFTFASGILYWLFNSGKLDFKLIKLSMNSGTNFYLSIIGLLSIVILTGFRWKLLLETKSDTKLRMSKILPAHWIGLFFSTFLPGVVTGDVLKLLYIKDLNKNFSKTFLFTSVLIDRVIGLSGLLFLSGLITSIHYNELISLSPKIKIFLNFNFLLGLGAVFFLVCLFLPRSFQDKVINLTSLVPIIGQKASNTLRQVWVIGQSKRTTIYCILLSILVQLIGILTIWTLTSPFYGKEISPMLLFGFIPIGLITIAIPISPAGAGVGHVVFDKLFNIVGVDGGASLFNIYFVLLVLVNFLGFIPYLLAGKRHSIKEAEDFEENKELSS